MTTTTNRSRHAAGESPRPTRQEQEDTSTEVTEVAPNILRTQLPISMPGLGHVNMYVMEDERGVAVVDPGLPGEESWNALVDRLTRAGHKVADVHTVVVTHSHPDHFGGAMRLRHESGAELVTHETFRTIWHSDEADDDEDSSTLEMNSADDQAEAMARYFSVPQSVGRHAGWPVARVHRADAERKRVERNGLRHSPADHHLDRRPDHQVGASGEWVAMHTPGHTYDHLCLHDPEFGVVLTGDHVLPSITPHISGLTPQSDPLAEFFASLVRMEDLGNVSVALPAHGHPFEDLGGRARHIIGHHEDRLDMIRDAQDTYRTARSPTSCACCSRNDRGATWPKAKPTLTSNTCVSSANSPAPR